MPTRLSWEAGEGALAGLVHEPSGGLAACGCGRDSATPPPPVDRPAPPQKRLARALKRLAGTPPQPRKRPVASHWLPRPLVGKPIFADNAGSLLLSWEPRNG